MERQQEEKSGTSIPKTSWNKKRKNTCRSGLANIFWNRAVSAHAFCARGFHFRATLRACKMRQSHLFSCPYLVQFRIALYDSRLSSALQLFPSLYIEKRNDGPCTASMQGFMDFHRTNSGACIGYTGTVSHPARRRTTFHLFCMPHSVVQQNSCF